MTTVGPGGPWGPGGPGSPGSPAAKNGSKNGSKMHQKWYLKHVKSNFYDTYKFINYKGWCCSCITGPNCLGGFARYGSTKWLKYWNHCRPRHVISQSLMNDAFLHLNAMATKASGTTHILVYNVEAISRPITQTWLQQLPHAIVM